MICGKFWTVSHNQKQVNLVLMSQVHMHGTPSILGFHTERARGCPRGVMVKAMDCGIIVREFVLQSHYYVHFRANILGKGMNPLILPAMG